MATTVEIEGVKITLTKEQLKQIDNQRSKKFKVEDINSIDVAEEILKDCEEHTKCVASDFSRDKDWINYQLETIVKAANFIDNGNKIYKPNFDDSSIWKHLPYFIKERSGWLLHCVCGSLCSSDCSVGLYFKEEKTANTIVKKHIKLYNQYLNG